MNTSFIGVKEFRAKMADYAKTARRTNTRYVVVNRGKPLFEVTPYAEDETLDNVIVDVVKAEQDVKAGKYYTHDELVQEFS
jgi:prevent-host-death family protein